MSRLDRLPEIIDGQHKDVRMSDQLKERVRQGIAQAEGSAQRPAKRPFYARRGLMAGIALAAACLVLLLVYAPFGGGEGPEPTGPVASDPVGPPVAGLGGIAVRAQTEAAGGVAVSTAFIIETGDLGLTAQAVESGLSVEPAVDYSLEDQGAGQFLLTPQSHLEKGTVYKISLAALAAPEGGEDAPDALPQLSWAFQTESENRLVSSLPADSSGWAPLDTGIEMTFAFAVQDAGQHITISPQAEGRFEYYGKTVVFVPTEALLPDTLYRVDIASGLVGANGERLDKPYAFSFRTGLSGGEAPIFYLSGGITESFLRDDPVVVELYSPNCWDGVNIPVDVRVYGLSGEDHSALLREYYAGLHSQLGRSTDHVFDTQGLAELYAYQGEIIASNNYAHYVVLPDTPQSDYCLVDIRPREAGATATPVIQKLVNISDLSVWVQSLNGQSLVWVNSAATGQPVSGAQVTFTHDFGADIMSGTTGQDGLLLLESAGIPQRGVCAVHISAGEEQLSAVVPLAAAQQTRADEKWQACLFFDRAAYLPTDTIRYWGVVLPRDGVSALPQGLRLTLDTLPDQTITLGETGAFSGEITYENLLSTYMTATLAVGEDALAHCGIQVMEYTKPTYVLDVSSDRPYYRPGQQAGIQVAASFFDGTPAPGLQLKIGGSDYTTDGAGRAAYVHNFLNQSRATWRPQSSYISVYTAGQEDATVWADTLTTHFITDYMQQLEVVEVEGGWQLEAATSHIDYDAVDAWLAEHPGVFYGEDFEAAIAGAAYDQSMGVEVVRHEWVRTETGEVYDYINKRMRKTYTYNRQDTVVDTFTLGTTEGRATSKLLPYQSTATVYYTLAITLRTPDGASLAYSLNCGDSGWYYDESGYRRFYLMSDSNLFVEGGALSAQLYEGGMPAEAGGRMLYTVSQATMQNWHITEETTLTVGCTASHIPNFTIMAAYFDGRHIYPVNGLYASYDSAGRALDIDIRSDRQAYAPGDTATVTVSIRDADGRGKQADFVLSVVDEAAFAVAEQHVDILSSLYRGIYYTWPSTFASYVQHDMLDGQFAEEGGEGDASGLRQDFVDTAAFLTGRTGPDGTATLTFTVPDNITAWRLTCAAVSADGMGGARTGNVAATLPFFVNTVASRQYVAGDDVIISARGAGVSVASLDKVSYRAEIAGASLSDTLTVQHSAGEYAYFNFGKLPLGQYEITLTAQCGTFRDAVLLPLEVVDSRLEIPVDAVLDLGELGGLESRRYPVTLSFFDPALEAWMGRVYSLAGLRGQRADQRLARAAALDMLAGLGAQAEHEADLSGVQQYDGGIALFGYSQSDAGLTAAALAACPQQINAEAAVSYLYGVLYNRGSDAMAVANAYMGLAAAGEPVLLEIRALLGTRDDLSWNLPLCQGLALLGDRATARQWYADNVAPMVQPYGEAAFVNVETVGDGTYARASITAQAGALAAAVGHSDAAGLLAYLSQTRTVGDNALTVLMGVQAMPLPTVAGESTLSYTLDGQAVAATLTPERPVHTVLMHQSQLEAAGFGVKGGQVRVLASAVGGADDLDSDLPQGRATVNKRYEEMGGGRVAVRIRVHINTRMDPATDNLYKGRYTLTDVLPTGLRYLSTAYSGNNGWFVLGEEDGRVSVYLNTLKWVDGVEHQQEYFDIVYYARHALPGDFVAESAVLTHGATGGTVTSPRASYTVP